MRSRSGQLPSRFPVGTRYVVEGSRRLRGGLHIRARYLEFPNGVHLDLPAHNPDRSHAGRRPARRLGRK
jgi:hypothetical protein